MFVPEIHPRALSYLLLMLVTSTGLRVLLASLLIVTPALGGLLTDPSQLAKDLTYDYIVVGGEYLASSVFFRYR